MSFTKLKPIEGTTVCLTCGCGSHNTLNMDSILAVGFGDCTVSKNGEHVYSEQQQLHKYNEWEKTDKSTPEPMLWQASDAEQLAIKDPDNDWRISFFAPLYEAEYQRQGDGHWVLVSKGEGFA